MATEFLLQFWLDTQLWKSQLDPVIGQPVSPEDSAWDEKTKPPISLYVALGIYVFLSLVFGPPLLRYRPQMPLHIVFFVINVITLIVHTALFMNSLVMFFSRSSLPIRLIGLFLWPQNPYLVNLTWIHCAMRVFGMISDALFILHHRHDNYRVVKMTYFLIQMTNIWMRLRFGGPSFFSVAGFYSFIMDLIMLFYTSFENRMHLACPELKTKVERTLCGMLMGTLFK
jgi:hypothetical protein